VKAIARQLEDGITRLVSTIRTAISSPMPLRLSSDLSLPFLSAPSCAAAKVAVLGATIMALAACSQQNAAWNAIDPADDGEQRRGEGSKKASSLGMELAPLLAEHCTLGGPLSRRQSLDRSRPSAQHPECGSCAQRPLSAQGPARKLRIFPKQIRPLDKEWQGAFFTPFGTMA
jgi:hypothetical protein